MQPVPPETRRIQSLLTSLVLLTLLIIGLVLAIAAYPTLLKPILAPATPPIATIRPTQTTPPDTATPTITRTLRPTLTPSITPTATLATPGEATATPLGPATLTPAQPVRGDPYKLVEWNADLANLAIDLLQDYPNTLITRLRGEDNAGYYTAFRYAVLAGQEGLLRFPDASQALQWRFGLAYSLAQIGQGRAGEVYAELLAGALNQDLTSLEGLPNWFNSQEPRLLLNLIKLTPPSGFPSSHILEVHGAGSALLWLLESYTGFQAIPLAENFDFITQPEMRLILADLTGDGVEEIALFNNQVTGDSLELPRVFDLSSYPPIELPFRPSDPLFNPALEAQNNWRIVKSDQGASSLAFELNLFPACPLTIQRPYTWNGTYFEAGDTRYTVEPYPNTLSLCRVLVEQADSVWGPVAKIQIIDTLLPDWPPASDEAGKAFPADAKDDWRFQLGIAWALSGDSVQATQVLNELLQQPSVPGSRWIEPARQFLASYQQPQDIYRACLETNACSPATALAVLVNQLGVTAGQDPLEYLAARGLTLRSSGYFDFDGDGVKERWFAARHRPLEKLDLWILAETQPGLQAIRVENIEGDKPTLQILNDDETPPTVWVDAGLYIIAHRDLDSGRISIQRVSPSLQFPDRLALEVSAARQALFEQEDTEKALEMLLSTQKTFTNYCKSTWTCDELLYLVGLANELLGNERPAIDAYISLWRDYSRSPFTTLARLKLAGTIILPTPLPTNTLSPFTTPTLVPGQTVFPTLPPQPTSSDVYPTPEATATFQPTLPVGYPTP